MSKVSCVLPLAVMPGCRARRVSPIARINNVFFGAPNFRRANGIVESRFDVIGFLGRLIARLARNDVSAPVFEIDRIGSMSGESLPRIWLSERIGNTHHDDGRRIFVESYPTGPDRGGHEALELGDRYLGEGLCPTNDASDAERKECLKAAEILYMHAVKRGNRHAAARLRDMYENDLCEGEYWQPYIEVRARHAKRRSPEKGGRLRRVA